MSRLPIKTLRIHTPLLAVVTAVALVFAGVAGAALSERDFREAKVEQAQAHARVLAASVSAALAFQDAAEAQHAVDALTANPDVGSVGVYTVTGDLFVRRVGPEGAPPARLQQAGEARYDNGFATASAPVVQNETPLGAVHVRLSSGSAATRWARYIGVALLLGMAALIVIVIGEAQRALNTANDELSRRAEALAKSNQQLSSEINEKRKAQNALAQGQKMEAIGQLTGGVAHDFNNLLMVISSGLRLLETRDDESKRASIVAAMRQAVDRGAGLTKQLLAFSRRQKLTPEVIRLQERIENLRPLLERSLREDIALEVRSTAPDAAVKVDPGQFDIAILNLAVNARDAMPNGGSLVITIAPAGPDEPDAIAVRVADSGQGMAPEVQARAFDPFFTTKEVGKGTGLGLSQVYGFSMQSGGRSEIESEPGRGTAVTLILPLSEEAPPPRQAPAPDAAGGSGAVLVVEDDDSVAAMVCEMIADLGYSVTRVPNAHEALQRIEGGAQVDLIFSDIIMPGGLNGIELAHEVRRRRPELPILLTTGYGGRGETEVQGFKVLRKPYDRDELGAAFAEIGA
ncbi:MAG TPA: ATP-binding protein [Vitreimonas sp.]|uniref:ATP-binding protein n=1 Tax=Vitreimonas sp. TaxID=3069702 RepID=UPI002D3492E1|nr:ATP-binding protein [Vitreimonas sp.]HYD87168.1 ATP-binding protein [Vitreimonas sp.]